jgi:hypothetical protein
MSSCVRRSEYLSRHKRLDVFHVMIRIFSVYLFHCSLHLYAVSQPLPNCVSSSITACVCVCVFKAIRRCVCSVLTQRHVFPFLFVFVFVLLFTVLPMCLTRRPYCFGSIYVATKTVSNTGSWSSSIRNIKDATRNPQ